MRIAAVLLLAVTCSPAVASEPGQPLDCSDWVFTEPGLSCSYWFMYPCPTTGPTAQLWCGIAPSPDQMDNQGRLFRIDNDNVVGNCPGGGGTVTLFRHRVFAFDGLAEHVIAYIDDRCLPDGRWEPVERAVSIAVFEKERGERIISGLTSENCDGSGCQAVYPPVPWIAAISGFPTTFDVLQTYIPQPATLGFRVPYMPEGMAAADHFDTYRGPISHPIDFAQAHPLQCDYPTSAPHVGDYLTVNDTLPTPQPGTGYYYVTATTYQGQTRYGRKTTAGRLSGRDPALLPACVQP